MGKTMSVRRTASADGHPFVQKTAAFLLRHDMVPADCTICVAVSGGADSMALLHALAALRGERGMELRVAHVNHGLRGRESDADEALVRDEARRLDLPLDLLTIAPGSEPATGLEEWAREQRLAFYLGLLAEGNRRRVATGHTQRDQAETVLFRLLRGAGPDGLAGILPVTSIGLVRPLLWATREEVMAFLEERQIPWREDASNADPQFARNRIRNDWLPALRGAWNPRMDQALAGTAEIFREENDYLDRIADEEIARDFRESVYGWEAAVSALAALPTAISRRVVRRLARRISGASLEFAHVERMRALFTSSGAFSAQGVLAERSGTQFRLAHQDRVPDRENRPEWELRIRAPGRFPLPGGQEDLVVVPVPESLESLNSFNRLDSGYTEGWSFLRLPGPECVLRVRRWHPGETFQVAGSSRTRKLKELFQRRGVPRWRRDSAVVLEWQDKLLWCRYLGAASSWESVSRDAISVAEPGWAPTGWASTNWASPVGEVAVRCEASTMKQDSLPGPEPGERGWSQTNPAEWESSSGSATS
jgi:tRNA(Ile)-lysidine synthase